VFNENYTSCDVNVAELASTWSEWWTYEGISG